MFNSVFRILRAPMTRSVNPTFMLDYLAKGDIGNTNGQNASSVRHFRNNPIRYPKPKTVYYPEQLEDQEVIVDDPVADMHITEDVISNVNSQISGHTHGRLFAVIYLRGKQYKVTQGDLIVIEGTWAPEPGDAIRLEKVLLIGCSDFTLLGKPLLMPDLARVTATVTDRTLEATRYYFRYRPREQKKTSRFRRSQMTTMRITSIELTSLLDEHREIEGLEGRVL